MQYKSNFLLYPLNEKCVKVLMLLKMLQNGTKLCDGNIYFVTDDFDMLYIQLRQKILIHVS